MPRKLEEYLSQLADLEAIRACISQYARAADRADMEMFRQCFHPDAYLDLGMATGSPDDIIRWLAPRLDKITTHHSVTNISCEISGDEAFCETLLSYVGFNIDGSSETSGGRYIDVLRLKEGVWRICRRTLLIEWSGKLDHLTANSQMDQRCRRDRTDLSYSR